MVTLLQPKVKDIFPTNEFNALKSTLTKEKTDVQSKLKNIDTVIETARQPANQTTRQPTNTPLQLTFNVENETNRSHPMRTRSQKLITSYSTDTFIVSRILSYLLV
jgi:hypothetical protein